LAKWADSVIIAPATANIIGKIAAGIADDFLSTFIMATKAQVVIAPAMNDQMYDNPIVQRNMSYLRQIGYIILEAEVGHLACGTSGKGRMVEPIRLADYMLNLSNQDLSGKKIMITAGPTKESIDPVRYITNHSSGKMGYALAKRAAARGAEVLLVSGNKSLDTPWGVKVVYIDTAEQMYQVVIDNFASQDAVIKAAAVANWRPINCSNEKIKKHEGTWAIELERTKDILAYLGEHKNGQVLAGFAAETENIVENALKKLKKKNLDLIIANDLKQQGGVFGQDDNQVVIFTKKGEQISLPKMSKEAVADEILNQVKLCIDEK